jgi:hypothetical protein
MGDVEGVEDAADRVIDPGQHGDLENACSAEGLDGFLVQIVVDVMGSGQREGQAVCDLLRRGQGVGQAGGDELGDLAF